jgi:hypothetical protein
MRNGVWQTEEIARGLPIRRMRSILSHVDHPISNRSLCGLCLIFSHPSASVLEELRPPLLLVLVRTVSIFIVDYYYYYYFFFFFFYFFFFFFLEKVAPALHKAAGVLLVQPLLAPLAVPLAPQ